MLRPLALLLLAPLLGAAVTAVSTPRPVARVAARVAARVSARPAGASRALDTAGLGRRVDSALARFGAATPGCAIAVAHGDDLLVERAAGRAFLEGPGDLTPATIFEAGSVSKQVTAAAVLLLAARGEIALDVPIQRWFPEIPEYDAPITVRHLLQHTSGLRDWGAIAALEGWRRGLRDHTHAHVLAIIARQRGLNHLPGAEFSYTNSGYNLLAMLVERVTGKPFARFTEAEFFAPLGMTKTSWRDDPYRTVPGRAQAYSPGGGGYRLDMPFEHAHGNGGLLTTVGDLLRFTDAIADGRVGTPDVSGVMQTEGVLNDGQGAGYGGGLFLGAFLGEPAVYHTGATAGYRAVLARFPASDVRAAVLCNLSTAGAGDVLRTALGTMHRATRASAARGGQAAGRASPDDDVAAASATPSARPRPLTGAEEDALLGTYESDEARARLVVMRRNGRLAVVRSIASTQTLMPLAADTFRLDPVTTLRVMRDATGRVTGLAITIPRARDVAYARVSTDTVPHW